MLLLGHMDTVRGSYGYCLLVRILLLVYMGIISWYGYYLLVSILVSMYTIIGWYEENFLLFV